MLLIHLGINSDAHPLELLTINLDNSFERQSWNMQHFNPKISSLRNYVFQLTSDCFCQRLFNAFSMSMISFSIEQILNILSSGSQYRW